MRRTVLRAGEVAPKPIEPRDRCGGAAPGSTAPTIQEYTLGMDLSVDCTDTSTRGNEYRRNHIAAKRQLLHGTAVDDPTDAPTHHRCISANTPQPKYSRV